MIAYTIGHIKNYEKVIADHPDDHFKAGAFDDYDGGYIWKTREEAKAFIDSTDFLKVNWGDNLPRHPKDFSVFQVHLESWSDI